jgi:hypothetical protein
MEFEFLRFLTDRMEVRAAVPASVVSESVANHSREYSRARKQWLKARSGLNKVAGTGIDRGLEVPEFSDYSTQLSSRLEIVNIEVLPFPEVTHADLVARCTQRLPPFDESGSGYRDTLVWITCVELAAAGEDVFLVSQDRDFAGRDLELAESLADEIAALPGAVTLVRNLGSCLMQFMPWKDVTNLREAVAIARDEMVAVWFAPWDIFEDPQLSSDELGLPRGAEVREVSYGGSGDGVIEKIESSRLGNGTFRDTYRFPIEFNVEMTLPAEVARAEGYLIGENTPSSVEVIRTSVHMVGQMVVIHDSAAEFPFSYDSFEFRPRGGGSAWNRNVDLSGRSE